MILQFLVFTIFLMGLPLAGLGVKLLVQPHSRLSETQLNRYREMQQRSIIHNRENDASHKEENS
jgi:hypothetical protein